MWRSARGVVVTIEDSGLVDGPAALGPPCGRCPSEPLDLTTLSRGPGWGWRWWGAWRANTA